MTMYIKLRRLTLKNPKTKQLKQPKTKKPKHIRHFSKTKKPKHIHQP